ncbi:helix-turn-helix domain-containing protein [Plantactinospora sp. WMMB334]|uniref:helix-turn-helix domain-containing protein n=1 Tax=Plantactinospora sp. WMMB334 TaxID=3404119 RepID=UPI003B9631C7
MPAPQPSPILRRRRLGAELRKLRESARLTGDQVIEAVGWASASKLSRLENGRSRPDLRDVLDLLDLYKVTGDRREELTAITNEAGDIRAWLRSYATMTPRQRGYAELEAGCAEILEYSPVIVPGLLQSKAYVKLRILSSRQLVNDPDQDDTEDADTEVKARLARQSLLTREVEPPRYSAVIEEAALGDRAGPREVLRTQLLQLRKLAGLPNVTIQVLPTEQTIADWYLPHTGFSLYRFAEPEDPETLAIEGLATNLMVTDQKEISTYSMVFEWLQDAALGPEETITWLTERAEQRSSGPARKPAGRDPGMPPTQRSRRSGRLTEQ